MMTCVLLFTLPRYNYNCESFCFYIIHYLCLCWSYLYKFLLLTFTVIHRNKGLASVVSLYTHGYVIAVWGLLGAEKENESWIIFKNPWGLIVIWLTVFWGTLGGEQSCSWSFLWAVKWGNYRYCWFWERVFRIWVFFFFYNFLE